MTVVQTDPSPTVPRCVSTHPIGTTQVTVDFIPKQVEADVIRKRQLYDDLLDGLNRLDYSGSEITDLMNLFRQLSAAVKARRPQGDVTKSKRGIYRMPMVMDAHDLLEEFMKDKAPAATGSLHDIANQVFLPDDMTFVHDATHYCVVEARKKR